jgi:hypothetical protein
MSLDGPSLQMPASKTLVAIGATADIRIAIGSLEMTRLTHLCHSTINFAVMPSSLQ